MVRHYIGLHQINLVKFLPKLPNQRAQWVTRRLAQGEENCLNEYSLLASPEWLRTLNYLGETCFHDFAPFDHWFIFTVLIVGEGFHSRSGPPGKSARSPEVLSAIKPSSGTLLKKVINLVSLRKRQSSEQRVFPCLETCLAMHTGSFC